MPMQRSAMLLCALIDLIDQPADQLADQLASSGAKDNCTDGDSGARGAGSGDILGQPVAFALLDAQCPRAVGDLIEQHWYMGGEPLLALLQLQVTADQKHLRLLLLTCLCNLSLSICDASPAVKTHQLVILFGISRFSGSPL